jgi:hypothetical protein
MANGANDFDPSYLVVQQTKIYYDVRTDIGGHNKLGITSTLISGLWLKI